MSYEISSENAAFIEDQVAKGAYRDPNEGLNEAVRLLKRRAKLFDRMEQAYEQIEAGQFIELDEAGLDNYFRDLEVIANCS